MGDAVEYILQLVVQIKLAKFDFKNAYPIVLIHPQKKKEAHLGNFMGRENIYTLSRTLAFWLKIALKISLADMIS